MSEEFKNDPTMKGSHPSENSGSEPVLEEIVRRLVEVYRPERIYLFGSKARGDEGPNSDYDLFVVVPDNTPLEKRKSQLAYTALWGTRSAVDVVVWQRSPFERRARVVCSLPATVLREGRLLYAA